ncbi:hypothetical protein PC116_g20664 [Phytophthora cactorum]|uniref:Uncharacterized protein n=1 Tax=Phytophthora cactorum TaxID=29920 RepID=A0A329RQJ2_9STRA|nr:hypothetical protein Pcac1_g15754 [Phytophthora cactorum]KAG2893148.1 hypothetical protein PC114_g16348 [Phytophthora cactorum]KAG2906601.1 hypothetical protein PC115_g14230 [Phytophthora cactorum]KAG2923491.1 hypothetical protein PC117_g15721 [Phytophthora cactorum]KAG3003663.1 hypothetical protein PC119_g15879 [Phytophthora cactorum]
MPKRIPWTERAVAADARDAELIFDAYKSFDIGKSNTMVCTVFTDANVHKRRRRLLQCSSETCSECSELPYSCRGKLPTCLTTNRISFYEFGGHASDAMSLKKKKLTMSQKTLCREMAEHNLRPMRIRHALSRKFDTPLENQPVLRVVQNFVNHYSRTHLENHERVDEIRKWIHARAFNGDDAMGHTFIFGWELDREGRPEVGNGSDERPFIVGISTKALM